MAKEILGKGFTFPLRLSVNGSFSISEYEDDIREAIGIIISTAPGERIMRPDFGCGIHDLVFTTINTATMARAEADVKEALIKYEPRIEVDEVKVTSDSTFNGKLLIDIHYRIRETNNAFNYVYDFYLHEGNG